MLAVSEKDRKVTRKGNQEESRKTGGKRYNLVLPNPLFEEVQKLANEQNTSVLELLKRFIKIGLLVAKLSQSPNTAVIIREGDKEREVLFM